MRLELLAKKTFSVRSYLLEEEYAFPASRHLVNDEEEYIDYQFFYGQRHEIESYDSEDSENYYGVIFYYPSLKHLDYYVECIPKEFAIIDDLFAIQDQLYQKI